MTVKILAACGAGVNSSHQIKDAIEKEFKKRGYDVQADAVMVKDVNEDMIKNYDIFTPIAKTDLGFTQTFQSLMLDRFCTGCRLWLNPFMTRSRMSSKKKI